MPDLDYIFHPRSIAIVGASPNPTSAAYYFYLKPLILSGYEGPIYPIHPTATELSGLTAYRSILDVPGTVDHVVCVIKAALAPQLIRDCATKGAKTIHLFTAGFSETGDDGDRRLEAEIARIARESGIRLIGPNGMGIYCPSSRIAYDPAMPLSSGGAGLLAQSGGNSVEIIVLGKQRGLYFSKGISFGNACDVNEVELLEYFADDPETRVILGYIEGTRHGKRFAQALRRATEAKPVVILKGGRTAEGNRAVSSHTGALAGNGAVWSTLFRQLGVVPVDEMEELIDMALLFVNWEPPRGRRTGLVGNGGGCAVLSTDTCARRGLTVPVLSDSVMRRLRELVPKEDDPGTSVHNPVDISRFGMNPQVFGPCIETVAASTDVDLLVMYTNALAIQESEFLIETKAKLDKPLAVVLRSDSSDTALQAHQMQEAWGRAGIPVFPTFDRAARAIDRYMRYYERTR